MAQKIKIKCPAKINLSLKIVDKRPDGFHNIESIMQTINLFDYLTINVTPAENLKITLNGTSNEIPYDERNIVFKAAKLFAQTLSLNANIDIHIEKHIPVSAGLAGGSTDAAGTIFGLNEIYNTPLNKEQLHHLCAQLGSDLNFCLDGGCKRATSRGEILHDADFKELKLSLIKPIKLGISAKEAYTKFAQKTKTPTRNEFVNDLEWAVIDDYPELQLIKQKHPQAIMTGSGSTYFIFNTQIPPLAGYWIKNNLITIPYGVKTVS